MPLAAGSLKRLAPRLALAGAWFVPTMVVVMRTPMPPRAAAMVGWSLAASVTAAFLPGNGLLAALVAAWMSLPVMIWWLGYASLNGLGPGWEAAQAVFGVGPAGMIEAARIAVQSPGILLGLAAHATLLVIATVSWRAARDRPEQPEDAGAAQRIFLAGLAPLAFAMVWQTADRNAPALMSPIDGFGSALGTYAALANKAAEHALIDYGEDRVRAPVEATTKITSPMLSIFVVGESVRADVFGHRNAARGPWTKALDERIGRGLGRWLPATCASANGTQMSVPMLVTGTDPDHKADSDRAPSGLARLKGAGYTTAWITNQELLVFKEQGHDYTWIGPDVYRYRYDEVMIPLAQAFAGPLLGANAATAGPRAILLHELGAHFEYEERYPGKLFPPEPAGATPDDLKELRYERATEYGAKVLTEIADLIDAAAVPAFALYTADHGENLPRDHNGLVAHLGPRTSLRDGTTSSIVLWNRAFADTGRPQAILARLVESGMIAHRDVFRAWMALSGVDSGPVEPTPEPRIWANPELGDAYRPVSCATLRP
jgi:glucan phosphoethanolaminetransferase (alkaline phosphatase superfamily)